MCRNLIPLSASVLPAGRLWRKDRSLYHHPSFSDHVLPAHLRDYPLYFISSAATWEVSPFHHAAGRPLRGHYNYGVERALPEAQYAQDGVMG